MGPDSHWEYGWYGDEFIVTEQDQNGLVIKQLVIPESVAIAMIPFLQSCYERRKEA